MTQIQKTHVEQTRKALKAREAYLASIHKTLGDFGIVDFGEVRWDDDGGVVLAVKIRPRVFGSGVEW